MFTWGINTSDGRITFKWISRIDIVRNGGRNMEVTQDTRHNFVSVLMNP